MSCNKKNAPAMKPVVRVPAILMLGLAALTAAPMALAVDSGDIVVVSVKGEVRVTMSGAPRDVRAGSVLEPPATLRTGRDGTVELRQGATTLSVGPETLLEFPALEKRGAPIDRLVQPRGNVFYNIGKREGRKLRIETPFLVGVVKGTQFNVAAQDETTTISLFEGLLEVHAADESGSVDLKAGEIASRQRDDKGVSVMKMDGVKVPATPRQPQGSGTNTGVPKPMPPSANPLDDRDSVVADSLATNANLAAGLTSVDVVAAPPFEATTPLDTGAAMGAPAVETSTAGNVDAISSSVDTGAATNLSAPAVDVFVSASVDAGPASVDTGAAVDTNGPDVDVSTTVDAGPVAQGADAAVGAGIATGPASIADLGVEAEVGTSSGHGRFTVVVGASSNQHEVTVGSANAAEAVANSGHGNGNGNHGTDVTIDLGVDLGHEDDSATAPSTDTTGTDKPGHSPPADVVDLLDGLLRRRGKK